jgi:hypothetical protein
MENDQADQTVQCDLSPECIGFLDTQCDKFRLSGEPWTRRSDAIVAIVDAVRCAEMDLRHIRSTGDLRTLIMSVLRDYSGG